MASGWEASYQDPLRWKAPQAATESCCTGIPRVDDVENEMCSVKLVVMHKPTHEPQREKTGQYPFAAHLSGKRRLWELRFQLRFKQVPRGQPFFGLELGEFVPISMVTRQVQKTLVGACKSIVGNCYHSNGDDPSRVTGELEPPTFVMPLWAFDSFEASDPGSEPDLTGSLDGRGMVRAEVGVKAYIRAMQASISSFSTDKVYTFGFWGISRFLDFMKWEVCGDLLPGLRLDFNRLCGRPPVTMAIYDIDLPDGDDKRHLRSRKRYFMNVAAWSMTCPPKAGLVDMGAVAAEPAPSIDDATIMEALSKSTVADAPNVDLLGFGDDEPKTDHATVDLLGLVDDAPKTAQVATTYAPAKQTETCDLLGLDL